LLEFIQDSCIKLVSEHNREFTDYSLTLQSSSILKPHFQHLDRAPLSLNTHRVVKEPKLHKTA